MRSCCKRGIRNTLVVILGEVREGKDGRTELRRSWGYRRAGQRILKSVKSQDY
ncbi:MAG: hypothetical protein ACJ71J_15270 [Nitrososphaeraceae archaeon]